MTDRNKFEQMLEYLIAEEQDKAQEIFHQIVVEKSREIYENILAEDFEENFEVDEASPIGGDATDSFISDVEADGEEEFGDEEGEEEFGDEEGEGDIEDRVMDLEDALDELKAEFEQLMSGEESDESDEGEESDDMDFGDEEDEEDEEPKEDFMREYVEKVTAPKMGDDGANTKSVVAKKNDMGGTTANLRGGESKGEGTKGGLLNPSTKEDNAGNVNVPGAKKAATLSKVGAPKMGDDGANTNSPLNGAPKRAK